MKLRDLSLSEKQQSTKRIKELEKESSQVPILEEKALNFETKLLEAEENLEDLKEQLDVALEAEDMVQELNDKNMDLSAKIEELQGNIEELEELKDLSEELEEQQTEEIKKLRKQIHLMEIKELDQETTFKNLHKQFSEQQQVIVKYREKTLELQEKLYEFVESEQEKSIETINLENKIQNLMDENLQFSTKIQKINVIQMDKEFADINSNILSKKMEFLCSYVPSEVFKEDMEVIDCFLLVKEFLKKTNLAIDYVKNQYQLHDYVVSSKTNDVKENEERFFAFKIIRSLVSISTLLHEIHENMIKEKSTDKWLEFNHLQWDLKAQQHSIDVLLNSIKLNEFNESFSMDHILKAERIIKSLAQKYNLLPQRNLSLESLRNIVYDSQEFILTHQKIQRSVSLALSLHSETSISSEVEETCKGEEMKQRIKQILLPCRKALKLLQSDLFYHINEKDFSKITMIISFSATLHEYLSIIQQLNSIISTKLSDSFDSDTSATKVKQILLETLESLINKTKQPEQITIVEEGEEQTSATNNNDTIIADSSDKISSSPWSFVETGLTKLTKALELYSNDLQEIFDRYELQNKDEQQENDQNRDNDSQFSAFEKRSKLYRGEFESLSILKANDEKNQEKLKENENNIQALEKSLENSNQIQKILQGKIEKLNEKVEKLNEQLINEQNEAKVQIKSWEDALVAMQEDIDLLEREKSDLLEKVSLQSKYGSLSQNNENDENSSLRVPLQAVNKEIHGLRSAISYLQDENSILRSKLSSNSLKDLGKIDFQPSSSSSSSSSISVSNLVTNYRKELHGLLSRIQRLKNSPIVIELPFNDKLLNQKRNERSIELKLLQSKVDDLQDRIQHTISKIPSISKSSNFASFPDNSLLNQLTGNQKLVGKLNVPISDSLRSLLPSNIANHQKLCVPSHDVKQINSVVLLQAS